MSVLLTALAIIGLTLLVLLLAAGTVVLVVDAARGCPFAWFWLVLGGLKTNAELIGKLVEVLVGLLASLAGGGD